MPPDRPPPPLPPPLLLIDLPPPLLENSQWIHRLTKSVMISLHLRPLTLDSPKQSKKMKIRCLDK